MPSPRFPASRSIRPQAKPPGGLRPPPSPREFPRPRWAETFSLPANLAFGVSQKPKPPLCKGRRREAPEGSFWDRLQLFQNDVTPSMKIWQFRKFISTDTNNKNTLSRTAYTARLIFYYYGLIILLLQRYVIIKYPP